MNSEIQLFTDADNDYFARKRQSGNISIERLSKIYETSRWGALSFIFTSRQHSSW